MPGAPGRLAQLELWLACIQDGLVLHERGQGVRDDNFGSVRLPGRLQQMADRLVRRQAAVVLLEGGEGVHDDLYIDDIYIDVVAFRLSGGLGQFRGGVV